MVSGFSVPGTITAGLLSDVYDLRWCISLSSVGSALAVLFIWGFTSHLAMLLVFACIYGFLAGGFSCLWPKWIVVIATDDPHTYSMLIAVFSAKGRGIGNILAGPISARLLAHSPLYDTVPFGYGVKGYGALILFTGMAMLASTIAIAYPFFIRRNSRREHA